MTRRERVLAKWMGDRFKDRQEVTRSTHPTIWRTLQRESAKWFHDGDAVPQRS